MGCTGVHPFESRAKWKPGVMLRDRDQPRTAAAVSGLIVIFTLLMLLAERFAGLTRQMR